MAMGGRGGKSLMKPLLVINFVVYLIVLGLASWSLDKYIDGKQNHPHLGGNQSTIFLLIFALMAGVIGASSVLVGLVHFKEWSSHSLASAASSAVISWAITALAFGLVCNQIMMGGHRGKRLQTLEALVTIAAINQLLYILLLHAGLVHGRYGPVYGSHGPE